ncbi:MAG: aminoacyl-tRNA hydrolase [Candidatus Omnitrophota bacterium]
MKLIIGLGNPGFRYRATRHNIGFMVADRLAKRLGIKINNKLFNSLCGKGEIENVEVMLVKPLTYMNLSGKAVCEVMEKRGIPAEDILIIMDDIDLELGRIRLKEGGSAGTHNGLRSVIEELGIEGFSRLRVGIGPKTGEGLLRDFVLTPFKRSERGALDEAIADGSLCAEAWVKEGATAAMNRFNSTSPGF